MKDILIKNGRVVDPASKRDEQLDILVKDGKIVQLGKNLKPNGAETIDAKGKIVAPAFVDMHTHLRQPGREDEETFLTASRAAIKGGFGTLLAMPNTTPPCDNQGVAEYVIAEARKTALVNIYPAACVTKAQGGRELTEIGELAKAGVLAITDDGRPVFSVQIMRRALEYSKIFGMLLIDHCEDLELSGGVANEGYTATVLGLKGVPKEAESAIVARDLQLAKLTGGKLHIAHVSTAESVEFIRGAKRDKLNVTCEVTPHHFTLTDEAVLGYNTLAKVNPPLRSKEDIEALKSGLKDKTIDVIATDHAPHLDVEKDTEFDTASFGMVGLETALALSVMELVDKKVLSVGELIEKLSANPARILGLSAKGKLSEGADADIVVIDTEKHWKLDSLESKSKNTPFIGWKLKGKATDLVVGGKILMRNEEILA
ncbi:MAG: dihydroorotase [Candidatus Omnitrophota bacterium]